MGNALRIIGILVLIAGYILGTVGTVMIVGKVIDFFQEMMTDAMNGGSPPDGRQMQQEMEAALHGPKRAYWGGLGLRALGLAMLYGGIIMVWSRQRRERLAQLAQQPLMPY